MVTPYFAFTAAAGKLSKVHRPSSARAARPERPLAARAQPATSSERDILTTQTEWFAARVRAEFARVGFLGVPGSSGRLFPLRPQRSFHRPRPHHAGSPDGHPNP